MTILGKAPSVALSLSLVGCLAEWPQTPFAACVGRTEPAHDGVLALPAKVLGGFGLGVVDDRRVTGPDARGCNRGRLARAVCEDKEKAAEPAERHPPRQAFLQVALQRVNAHRRSPSAGGWAPSSTFWPRKWNVKAPHLPKNWALAKTRRPLNWAAIGCDNSSASKTPGIWFWVIPNRPSCAHLFPSCVCG